MSRSQRAVSGVAGAAALIAVLTLLARGAGLGRWFVFSATVGSSCVGSTYSTANLLPNVLYEVVAGGALAACVVPVLSARLVHADVSAANRAASAMLTWTVLVLVPVALAVGLFAKPLVHLLMQHVPCPGSEASAARMMVMFAPQVVLYGVGIVLVGVLQSHRRFVGPALAPLASSLVVIATYVLFAKVSERPVGSAAISWLPGRSSEALLAWGTTAGVGVLSLPLLVPAWRAGVRLRPTLRFDPGVARHARGLAGAGLAGLLAQQALVLVTVRLANGSGTAGTLNVYQYLQAVYVLPYALLAVPLATASAPTFARQAVAGDAAGYSSTLARSTHAVVLLSAIGTAALVAAAPAVQGVFLLSDVVGAGLHALAPGLTAFAPGLVGLALIAHLGRALFGAGQARASTRATVAGWLTAAALSVAVVLALTASGASDTGTLIGLGIASSIGMSVAAVLLLGAAGRLRIAGVSVGATLVQSRAALLRCLVFAVCAGVAGRLATDHIVAPQGWGAMVAGPIGALVATATITGGLAVTDRTALRALMSTRHEPRSK